MKSTQFSLRSFPLLILILGISIALVSWDSHRAGGHFRQAGNDTVPKNKVKRDKTIRDLDDVLNELDNADRSLNSQDFQGLFGELMKNFDGDKMRKNIENAMKNIDMQKLSMDVQTSMNKIDWDKMQLDVKDAMDKINWDQIKVQFDESMAKVDWGKMKSEIDKAMNNIDWKKMNQNLEALKDLNFDKLGEDLKKAESQLKNIGPQLEKAKVDIEKAKAEIREYKTFVNGLEADGLINKEAGYTIKHKDGELMVNGKKVSEETYSKYRSFLEKHPKFSIEKTDDDFDIDMD